MRKNKKFESKGTKVTDREVVKWANILSPEKIILLFTEDRISLTPEQLDKVIEMRNANPFKR